MFTGVIRHTGRVRAVEGGARGAVLRVAAPAVTRDLEEGSSISVDGVCLTVTALEEEGFRADVVPETLARTRLGELGAGDRVNLELPLRAGEFLDGHLVQGHVDGVGTVEEVRAEGSQRVVTVRAGAGLAPLVAEKGSVAINGVSLTVTAVGGECFSVALIPATLERTNLGALRRGSRVNLEVDVLARYVARLFEASAPAPAPDFPPAEGPGEGGVV